MEDKFTKTMLLACFMCLIVLIAYYIGYNRGISEQYKISKQVFDNAAEPYKTHNYDTSEFNYNRKNRFKEISSEQLLPVDAGAETLSAQSKENTQGAQH